MFEIGGNLAAARKGQSLTPADAERLTCLRVRYLEALENDDFDVLPGRVYARAFLRTYAEALGLDANRFVEEFDGRYPAPEEAPAVVVIRPRRKARLRPGVALAGAAAAAVAGAVAWSSLSPPSKTTPVSPPPPKASAVAHVRVPFAVTHTVVVQRRPALVIRATTGPSWLLVRRGGPNGAVLFEGTLDQGQSMKFEPRVWLRLGAPWNVVLGRGARAVAHLRAKTPVNLVA